MPTPLLSISIPTYNRETCLGTCLDSIVSQFENESSLLEQVEIVISDNASSDHTEELVQTYQKKYNNITYKKNEENIGFDKNLLQVIAMSSGTYCLTLGDDDALFDGSLRYLLSKIEQFDVPYFMLNCWSYDKTLSRQVSKEPNQHLDTDLSFETLQKFVKSIKNYRDTVGYFGSMSTQLFLRENWQQYPEKETYIGTQTVHLFLLLDAFRKKPFVLLAKPVIKTRNDNLRWFTYPGLETSWKRARATAKTYVWIKNIYGLKKNNAAVFFFFYRSCVSDYVKIVIKKILHRIGVQV